MGIRLGQLTKKIPMSELIERRFLPEVIEEAPIDATKIPANPK